MCGHGPKIPRSRLSIFYFHRTNSPNPWRPDLKENEAVGAAIWQNHLSHVFGFIAIFVFHRVFSNQDGPSRFFLHSGFAGTYVRKFPRYSCKFPRYSRKFPRYLCFVFLFLQEICCKPVFNCCESLAQAYHPIFWIAFFISSAKIAFFILCNGKGGQSVWRTWEHLKWPKIAIFQIF